MIPSCAARRSSIKCRVSRLPYAVNKRLVLFDHLVGSLPVVSEVGDQSSGGVLKNGMHACDQFVSAELSVSVQTWGVVRDRRHFRKLY